MDRRTHWISNIHTPYDLNYHKLWIGGDPRCFKKKTIK